MKRFAAVRISLGVAFGLLMPAAALAQSGPNNLTLGFTNLAVLDEAVDGHYEGWAIVGGQPISTGVFNVNELGQPVGLGGGGVIDEFDAGTDISGASNIVITLEPPDDNDPGPSSIKLLAAPVVDASAELRVNVPDRMTLEDATAGSFILATPSDNPKNEGNDDMGIWFLSTPGPQPGLTDLPDIGPNWTYEGWVVDLSDPMHPMPYSTGRFATTSGFDSDMAGCNGGGPPFPGEDFVAFQCGPVLDLDQGFFAAVITIEPVPDNDSGPFQLKPLAAMIETDALGRNNPMDNQALATFPTGIGHLFQAPVPTLETSWGSIKALYN